MLRDRLDQTRIRALRAEQILVNEEKPTIPPFCAK